MIEDNKQPNYLQEGLEGMVSKENISPSLRPMVTDMYEKGKNKSFTSQDYINEVQGDQAILGSYFGKEDKVSMTRAVDLDEAYVNVGGDYLPKFKDYRFGTDNMERFARQQSTGEKWKNGLTKAGAQFGSTVLGSVVGSVTGAYNFINSGFEMEAIYTDDFNKSLDEFNERLQYTLPNAYSKEEQNYNFGQSLGTANFWANDLPNGIAFTLGAIVSEGIWAAATGGASLATTAARWSLRAGKLGRIAKGVNGSQKMIGKLVRSSAKADNAIKKAKRASNLATGLNTARFMYTSAGYEAGVEARQMMKESKENFERYHQETYGRSPNSEERKEFEDSLTNAANAMWAGNMAVVGGSNLAIFGRMFKVGKPMLKSGNSLKSSFNRKAFGIGQKTTKEGGRLAKEALTPNKLQKVAGYTSSFGKSAFIEGIWEEGNQSVMGNLADDWLSSGYEEETAKETYSFIEGLYDSYAETFGSKEGWKEMGIGMIVGTIGGGISGQFGSYGRSLKNEKTYASAINSSRFGAQITADKMMSYARIIKANKDELAAQDRGDRTSEELARKRGILSFLSMTEKYDRSDESFEDFKTSIELTDSKKVAEENGISEQEVEDYKVAVLDEYKNLQETYADNKDFANIIVGESPSVDSKVDKSMVAEAIAYNMTMGKESSDHADIFLEEFVKEVSSVLSPSQALDFKDGAKLKNGLEKASKEKRKRYNDAQKAFNKINRQRNDLTKKIQSVQRKLSRLGAEQTDQKKKDADSLLSLTEQLNQLETVELPRARAEWETSSNIILANNPFSFSEDESYGFSTTSAERLSELSQIDEQGNLTGGILKNIDDSLQQLSEDNPVAYQRAQKMLTEYKRSIYAFKKYSETIQGVANENFKPTNLVTKLEKAIAKLRGTTENEFTRDFYASVGQSIIEGTELQAIEDVENSQNQTQTSSDVNETGDVPGTTSPDMTKAEYDKYQKDGIVSQGRLEKIAEKIKARSESIDNQIELNEFENGIFENETGKVNAILEKIREDSEISRLEGIIKKSLEKNSAIADYVGEDLATATDKRPSEKEIAEFRELHSKIKNSVFKSTSIVANADPTTLKENQGDNLNLSLEEIKRYQEINAKLASWQIQEGTMAGSDTTLADLIIRLQQLKTNVSTSNTADEQTNRDFINIVKASDRNSSTSREAKEMVQTPTDGAYLKIEKNGQRILSHVTAEGFINKYLPKFPENIFVKLPNKKTKQRVEDIEQLTSVQKQKGVIIYLEDSEMGNVNITVGNHARLIFSKEQWSEIEDKISLKFLYAQESDPQANSYLMGYEKLSDGTIQQAKSDFTYDTSDANRRPIALEDEMYDVNTVEVFIDPKNEYNRGLMEKLDQAKRSKVESAIKEAREELISGMSIYYMRAGKIIGEARAGTENLPKTKTSEAFLDLRKKAAKALEDTTESNLVNMQTTIPIAFTYYGSPIFTLSETEEGKVEAKPRAISTKDSKVIVGAGYVKDGKLFTGKDLDNTETLMQYLPKNSLKTPIVVFKYKGMNIAFPVSLVKRDAMLVEPFNQIIADSLLTEGQRVNKVNDFFILNGINPSDYNLKEEDLVDVNTIEGIQERLAGVKIFSDVETWTQDNFNLSRLRVEAMTAIDISGKPFNSPKLKLDLANKENSRSLEDEYSEYAVLSQIAEEEAALEEEFIKDLENAANVEDQERFQNEEDDIREALKQNGGSDTLFKIHEATSGNVRPKDFDAAIDKNTREGMKQASNMFVNKNATIPLDIQLQQLSGVLGYEVTLNDYAEYVSSRNLNPELYTKNYIAQYVLDGYTKLSPSEILSETRSILKSPNPIENVNKLKSRGVTEYQIDIIKRYAESVSKVKQEQQEMILGSDILKDLRKEFNKGCNS